MATATHTRRAVPGVNLPLLAGIFALIAVEAWYLTTQARSMMLPLIWLAPMDLLLLACAVDETLELIEVAMMLFFGRFLLLPFLFFSQVDSFLLFYGLFMAPVDAVFAYHVLRGFVRTVFGG